MAMCKRVVRLLTNSGLCSASNFRYLNTSSSLSPPGFHFLQLSETIKPNLKRAFLVDTLALVRGLEAQGVPSKQAEAITAALTEVLNDCLENVAHSFVSKSEMQRYEMVQDSNLSKFYSKVQSLQLQHSLSSHTQGWSQEFILGGLELDWPRAGEHHFSMLQRETEKLRSDIEKMRSELRYEIDKVTAGQRLDLNLERGRIRDELANQNAETSNLTSTLDREIHSLKTQLETAKYEVIKYCIGALISISAVVLRLTFYK
uniref:DUF1640 domain-containing protein n=1 Tax=Fagus sylvatica TaxID=28930 RepID=A0A2N9FPM0_FAGSY